MQDHNPPPSILFPPKKIPFPMLLSRLGLGETGQRKRGGGQENVQMLQVFSTRIQWFQVSTSKRKFNILGFHLLSFSIRKKAQKRKEETKKRIMQRIQYQIYQKLSLRVVTFNVNLMQDDQSICPNPTVVLFKYLIRHNKRQSSVSQPP